MAFTWRGWARREAPGRRSRIEAARRPGLERLEPRDLPASLVLPQTSVPTFTATFHMKLPFGGGSVLVTGHPVSGGNFLGTLDGTRLLATYCLDTSLNIVPAHTYPNASSDRAGTVYGAAVPKAAAISWLITHLGPSANTPLKQDALQAAIWRTEYGSDFQVDGVDNENGAPSFNQAMAATYRADLAALGTHTGSVADVAWISPGSNPDRTRGQGLVALTLNSHPTRTTLVSSANPSTLGRSLTFTATVVDISPRGAGTPTGTVQFQVDGRNFGAPVALSRGKAAIKVARLSVGTHAIAAIYRPNNGSFSTSTGRLSGGQRVHA